MSGLALILIAAWMMGTGWHANSTAAFAFLGQQKTVLPWLFAVIVLWALYQVDTLKGPIKAVSTLALIAIVLKQWPNIEKSASELKQDFNGQ